MRRPGLRWMTRRRTPRKPSWSTSRERGTSSLRARRSSTTRRTTSSTEPRASRMSSPTRRIRSRCTDARSSRGARGPRGLDRPLLLALRLDGQELRPDDARARREAGRGGGRRRPARLADLRRSSGGSDEVRSWSFLTARTTSPPRASAPGRSSPRRSSRRRASTAASAESRPPSSAARPRVRRTRSCAASAARRTSRTGERAFEPAWPVSKGHLWCQTPGHVSRAGSSACTWCWSVSTLRTRLSV